MKKKSTQSTDLNDTINLRLPKTLKRDLLDITKSQGLEISSNLRKIISQYVAKNKAA